MAVVPPDATVSFFCAATGPGGADTHWVNTLGSARWLLTRCASPRPRALQAPSDRQARRRDPVMLASVGGSGSAVDGTRDARAQRCGELLSLQVAADEDDRVEPLLARAPLGPLGEVVRLVHRLRRTSAIEGACGGCGERHDSQLKARAAWRRACSACMRSLPATCSTPFDRYL